MRLRCLSVVSALVLGAAVLGACPAPQGPEKPEVSVDPARALAQKVFQAAGGDKLSEVGELRFTFVYYQGDKRVFEAVHRFDRQKWRARVSWKDQAGSLRDVVIDLRTKEGQARIDGAVPASELESALKEKAYGRWVNDLYWLMMPLKVLDKGVTLVKEEPRTVEGVPYEILRMSFQNVGLTPGDTYWLYIDPKSYRVVRWDMKLEGQSDPPEAVTWEDYRAVGPLWLAFDHKEASGRVVFEKVEALPQVDEAGFTLAP